MRWRSLCSSLLAALPFGIGGNGFLDRIRAVSFAMLGLTAAAALALVAFAANQGWPQVGSLLPLPTAHRQAVGQNSIVAAPARGREPSQIALPAALVNATEAPLGGGLEASPPAQTHGGRAEGGGQEPAGNVIASIPVSGSNHPQPSPAPAGQPAATPTPAPAPEAPSGPTTSTPASSAPESSSPATTPPVSTPTTNPSPSTPDEGGAPEGGNGTGGEETGSGSEGGAGPEGAPGPESGPDSEGGSDEGEGDSGEEAGSESSDGDDSTPGSAPTPAPPDPVEIEAESPDPTPGAGTVPGTPADPSSDTSAQ